MSFEILYGRHVVASAMRAKRRKIHNLYASSNSLDKFIQYYADQKADIDLLWKNGKIKKLENNELYNLLNSKINKKTKDTKKFDVNKSIKENIFIETSQLDQPYIEDIIDIEHNSPLLILDQVTDLQNLGAIFRSALAFDAKAIIQQDRHSPPHNHILAKTSSGASEFIPDIRVTNINQTLRLLAKNGYFIIGLEANGKNEISKFSHLDKVALIFGSEENGIRPLNRQNCDEFASISISKKIDSLNVATSVAIALYAIMN